MFNIGDKVVYPVHGAGKIERIEEKEILGELHKYFVLNVYTKGLKLMIPVDNVEKLGLRYIVDEEMVLATLDVLSSKKSDMSDSWNRRYRDNMFKVKTGDILEVAMVVRDLEIRDREKGLSTGEKKMLVNTKQILASELALVRNLDPEESIKLIDDAINVAF